MNNGGVTTATSTAQEIQLPNVLCSYKKLWFPFVQCVDSHKQTPSHSMENPLTFPTVVDIHHHIHIVKNNILPEKKKIKL